MDFKYLFGPVPSRRLGISLGVDLVPHKVCNLNCIYCESGKTTIHTNKRDHYIDFEELKNELDSYLSKSPKLDYITFSGAGEPTLNVSLGIIIQHIKTHFPQYKLALITNSLILNNPEVRQEILLCDLIMPSLDAIDQNIFQKINRPVKGFLIEDVINGLISLRKEFIGLIWLEIFLLPQINDSLENIDKLKDILFKIKPDQIQLNTLDRPGTQKDLSPVSEEQMNALKYALSPLNVEIISRKRHVPQFESVDKNIEKSILDTINRRPCNFDDLQKVLNIGLTELNLIIEQLVTKELITIEETKSGKFLKANQ